MSASNYSNDEFNLVELLQDPRYTNPHFDDPTGQFNRIADNSMNSNQLVSTQFAPSQLSQNQLNQNQINQSQLSQLTTSSQPNPQINQSTGFIGAGYAMPIANGRNVYDSTPQAASYSDLQDGTYMTSMANDHFDDLFDHNEEDIFGAPQFAQTIQNDNYNELDRLFDKNLS